MKSVSSVFLAIVLLATGFIAGIIFSNFPVKQKLAVEKEQLDYLTEPHNFQIENSKRAYAASDTILNKILRLNEDGTIWSRGKVSSDPIKKLLWESYHCIGGNMQVLHNYDRQVYPEDSAFLKKYIKLGAWQLAWSVKTQTTKK